MGWEEVENCVKKYMLFYFFKDTSSSLFPDISIRIKNCISGTFLAVQWLRVCTFNAGAWSWFLVGGKKINKIAHSQALWKKKKNCTWSALQMLAFWNKILLACGLLSNLCNQSAWALKWTLFQETKWSSQGSVWSCGLAGRTPHVLALVRSSAPLASLPEHTF